MAQLEQRIGELVAEVKHLRATVENESVARQKDHDARIALEGSLNRCVERIKAIEDASLERAKEERLEAKDSRRTVSSRVWSFLAALALAFLCAVIGGFVSRLIR